MTTVTFLGCNRGKGHGSVKLNATTSVNGSDGELSVNGNRLVVIIFTCFRVESEIQSG